MSSSQTFRADTGELEKGQDAVGVEPVAQKNVEEADAESQPTNASAEPRSRLANIVQHFKKLEYTPKRCRWNSNAPPKFNWALCLLFAFSATFSVANLYYNHPILNVLASDFGVSYEAASRVPTLMQAGYAAGLLFLCPLGDIVRRRPFILALIFVTANIWLGLCFTKSFGTFLGLSFLAALTTVTPQLMLPLVAELAPPNRRATMISVVFAGLFMGVLIARIISGVITQFTSWRTVYFISFGLQYLLLLLLFFFFPDYPSVNPEGVSYFRILTTIAVLPFHNPILVQATIIAFLVSAPFVSFWTTLTFLLASPPFNLSSLAIGLFAFVGVPPFLVNPAVSHFIMDRTHPIYAAVLGLLIGVAGCLISTFIGTFSLAGPILQGILVDMGMIMTTTAMRTLLVPVEPRKRNRVNTVFTVGTFCGMLTGTAVGNALYAWGGWRYSGGANVAFFGAALVVCLARGPHEKGWMGWRGGWDWRKEKITVVGGAGKENPRSDPVADSDGMGTDLMTRPEASEMGYVGGEESLGDIDRA